MEIVALLLVFELKFDGIWIWASPTNSTRLFERDWIDSVFNDINTWDVFITKSCPIFKWIFNVEVNNDIISLAWLTISFANCFW